MKLIGSSTSPFVRRTRLLLNRLSCSYEFKNLDIYGEGREELKSLNPAMKIPVLIDDGKVIYDSNVIFRYLGELYPLAQQTWDQQNQLTMINAVSDSLVIMLMAKRSGINPDDDVLVFNLQRERIELSMNALHHLVADGAFESWDYRAICLYALLDWAEFRELISLDEYPQLKDWKERNSERPGVPETDPRRAV